ncbi:hypothetical protein vseg_021363 [Gypsophila vaccaria]
MPQNKVKMFFVPAIFGISHIMPLLNGSRFFASHPDVQVTIISTRETANIFQSDIDHDRESGYDIGFHIVDIPFAEVGLPVDTNPSKLLGSTSTNNLENMGRLFRALGLLSRPILELVRDRKPDYLVSDIMNLWAADVASEVGIPLMTFTPGSVFSVCVEDCLSRFKPYENVASEYEPFVLPGLPDKIELTRSRLPDYCTNEGIGREFKSSVQRASDMSYCMIVNSFDELELNYAEYCKNVIGLQCCLVGPVQCRSVTKSNSEGDKTIGDDVLEWLNRRKENSVLYVSFGSYAPICKEQFHEIAIGLEGSGHSFIWVARANLSGDQGDQGWFPEGFEERVKESNQGVIIKTWAPQEAILDHPSVGAFMTHCGWNSCLETLSHGVPVITWPLRVEQFNHERLMVDVLRVGFEVGNEEWTSQQGELKVTVTRDKVEAAVRRMMDSNAKDVIDMRKRAQQFAEKSRVAVHKGGSSYAHVYALVEELKVLGNKSQVIASKQPQSKRNAD